MTNKFPKFTPLPTAAPRDAAYDAAPLGKALYAQMKIVLATGTSSLLILSGCVVFMQSFGDLSYSQSAGLGFLVLPVMFLSWLLSFFSIIEWIKSISEKRFETRRQYLSVLPCLSMLCFSVLVLIFLIYRG